MDTNSPRMLSNSSDCMGIFTLYRLAAWERRLTKESWKGRALSK